MRAPFAASAADRISRCAILVAGVLCGVLVFFVAIPLALSNPFPALKEGEWVVHRSSFQLASLIPMAVVMETQALLEPVQSVSEPEPTLWDFVALPAHGEVPAFTPDESAPAQATGSTAANAAASERRVVSVMDEVDRYLWEVYQRAPTKRDSTGDFTWKDAAAAKRFGLSMPAYVIGGMDPYFREQLYHAGRAMDADGIRWSMLSAFRDDYRQRLAAGFKAGASNSLHGGKARTGGYGHGQAVDVHQRRRQERPRGLAVDRSARRQIWTFPTHARRRSGAHPDAQRVARDRAGVASDARRDRSGGSQDRTGKDKGRQGVVVIVVAPPVARSPARSRWASAALLRTLSIRDARKR
jgi:hypothetical protein